MCDRIIGLEYTNKSARGIGTTLLVQHIIIIILFLPVSLFYNESKTPLRCIIFLLLLLLMIILLFF